MPFGWIKTEIERERESVWKRKRREDSKSGRHIISSSRQLNRQQQADEVDEGGEGCSSNANKMV